MQRYIEQLIDDLHEIAGKMGNLHRETEKSVHDNETFFKHIENIETYLHGERMPVAAVTGIEYEQLPPPEKLSENQLALLATELENFLCYFHFALDFPQKFPAHLRYAFIRNFWKEKHAALTFGENHIEFCDYEKGNCPFPGYCTTCDENYDPATFDDFDTDKNEFPF